MNEATRYTQLRDQAERLARSPSAALTEEEKLDLLRLAHELEVNRVELLAQNEELRKASQKIESARDEFYDLFDSAPVALVILGANGLVERLNAAARGMLTPGPRPATGWGFSSFILDEDLEAYFGYLKVAVREGRSPGVELRLGRRTPRTRWVQIHAAPMHDGQGQLRLWRLVILDIDARKRSEEVLLQSRQRLAAQLAETERVNEELSQYAYAVSHDLKGPLRAIRNYADFLAEDLGATLSGDQRTYLEGLKRAVDEGDALIQDLLAYSRVGQVPMEQEAADVPGSVAEIISGLGLGREADVRVEPHWPPFATDPALLKQILRNLVDNGLKFNRSPSKRIAIGWHPAGDEGLEIYVRDNGIDIAPAYREQIFRIFQRLHTDREFGGTGIGLAIVQKAAHRLGGSVRLESEPGRGSTFFVRLPRHASPPRIDRLPATEGGEAPPSAPAPEERP